MLLKKCENTVFDEGKATFSHNGYGTDAENLRPHQKGSGYRCGHFRRQAERRYHWYAYNRQ
jgi:hypothetical protein